MHSNSESIKITLMSTKCVHVYMCWLQHGADSLLCFVMYGMSRDSEIQMCQHAQMTDKNMEKSWHS